MTNTLAPKKRPAVPGKPRLPMPLEKAIDILSQQVRYYHQIHQLDIIQALNLGIEALNHTLHARKFHAPDTYPLLPGETLQQ